MRPSPIGCFLQRTVGLDGVVGVAALERVATFASCCPPAEPCPCAEAHSSSRPWNNGVEGRDERWLAVWWWPEAVIHHPAVETAAVTGADEGREVSPSPDRAVHLNHCV